MLSTIVFITWSSRRQKSFVADSTEAAETFCRVEASIVNAWLRIKLDDSGACQDKPTLLLNDNKASLLNAKDGRITNNNKHRCRQVAFLGQEVASGNITPAYVASASNRANNGTKPVNRVEFVKERYAYMRVAVSSDL